MAGEENSRKVIVDIPLVVADLPWSLLIEYWKISLQPASSELFVQISLPVRLISISLSNGNVLVAVGDIPFHLPVNQCIDKVCTMWLVRRFLKYSRVSLFYSWLVRRFLKYSRVSLFFSSWAALWFIAQVNLGTGEALTIRHTWKWFVLTAHVP
jgi:hypothetical protein